jgi:hypothetical protein
MSKRTMTLNLTEQEMQVLDELCTRKGLNKPFGYIKPLTKGLSREKSSFLRTRTRVRKRSL